MKKWRDLLILVAVIVVVIMGVINILMQIDKLRDLSKPTGVGDWQDVSEPARSPYWLATHCDYIEIDPMDESPDLPDGVYENCDESSIKSPRKDLSDMHNDKTLDPTRTLPGEPARHWEPATPWGLLKGTTIY